MHILDERLHRLPHDSPPCVIAPSTKACNFITRQRLPKYRNQGTVTGEKHGMRQASLLAAVAVVLLVNAIALIHAARNRSGQPDAQIILTDKDSVLELRRHLDVPVIWLSPPNDPRCHPGFRADDQAARFACDPARG